MDLTQGGSWEDWKVRKSGGEEVPLGGRFLSEGVVTLPKRGILVSPEVPAGELDFYEVKVVSSSTNGPILFVFSGDRTVEEISGHHALQLEPSEEMREHSYFTRIKEGAGTMRVGFQSFGGDAKIASVQVRQIPAVEATALSEVLYSKLPPLNWEPDASRWKHLENTRRALKAGDTVRMLFLGDSIMNDIGNSPLDVLLGECYPHTTIEVLTSVRGATGCWFYQRPGNVEKYVLQRNPGLVLIGGISHHDDLEAVRSVIRQIRKHSSAEILLLTEAFGFPWRWQNLAQWPEEIPVNPENWRNRLSRLAQEENTGFFDLERIWGTYLREHDLEVTRLMRDNTHANELGAQVMARIFARFFCDSPQAKNSIEGS